MQNEGKIYRAGIPYAVDIKRLADAFPIESLEEGRVIRHSQLEEVLTDVPKGSHRYYAVVDSWIAQTRKMTSIFMVWEVTIGVKVLDPAETLLYSEGRLRQKMRQTTRAARNFQWVNRARLDDIGKARYDHQNRVALMVQDAMKAATKEMAVSLAPVASLPKPKLIREA